MTTYNPCDDPEYGKNCVYNTPDRLLSKEARRVKNEAPVASDPITLPHHYARFKIEPIRFIMENKLPFEVGNVVKYVCRHDAKNGIEDLKKARRYLDMMIAKAEGKEDFWK